MIKVLTVDQMRSIESATNEAGTSYDEMMQRAGRAVADTAVSLLADRVGESRVAVLVGPGNNGGDGLVAAKILHEEFGVQVGCYLLYRRGDDDPVFKAASDAGVFIADSADDQRWRVLKNLVASADVVIDALLGTGARLPIEGELAKLLTHAVNSLREQSSVKETSVWLGVPHLESRSSAIVLAVDCPSGLNCDTGEIDPAALHADVTVTFAGAKIGQLSFPGAAAVGQLVVADIGVPSDLKDLKDVQVEIATASEVAAILPQRPADSHKGVYGRAVIAAGSVPYTGAASLAGLAAYRVGAGLVTLAVPQIIYPILAAALPEVTWLLLPHDMGAINTNAVEVLFEEMGHAEALLVGPGLGQDPETAGFLRGLLRGEEQAKRGNIGFGGRNAVSESPAIPGKLLPERLAIDADGLNLLSEMDEWWRFLPPGTILTPHPGEMARLVESSVADVQADRLGIARKKAVEWGTIVVLKGAFTVVAGPDERVVMIPFAADALAKAGTGDVLAGCIVGLLAQGMKPFDASVAGAYIHALAGQLAGKEASTRSTVATDIIQTIPRALAALQPFD